jgi:hypothetical protein
MRTKPDETALSSLDAASAPLTSPVLSRPIPGLRLFLLLILISGVGVLGTLLFTHHIKAAVFSDTFEDY